MILAGLAVALVVSSTMPCSTWKRSCDGCASPGKRTRLDRPSFMKRRWRREAPTIYATLIVMLGRHAVFFMGGVAGAFFGPLASSYRAGGGGVHGGCVDRHTGVELHASGAKHRARFASRPSRARLRDRYETILRRVSSQTPRKMFIAVGVCGAGRLGVMPVPRSIAASVIQEGAAGELDHRARHVPCRDVSDHVPGQQRTAIASRGASPSARMWDAR